MVMVKMMNKSLQIGVLIILTSCSLAPGMHMKSISKSGESYVFIEELDQNFKINNISEDFVNSDVIMPYSIGNGDQIAITVWGLPDIFPIANMSPDQNLRRVDSKGNIYFPYVGIIRASGKTQDQLRDDLAEQLSQYFTNPQLDVAIARFNSQKVYMLGEITTPKKLNITDVPISLSEAIGEANGLNTNTSNGSEVFIIRQGQGQEKPKIFLADLSSPAGFISAGNFYLSDNDIVYVNAKGTTRWNKVISQFFPFSSFLNSVDNLTSD